MGAVCRLRQLRIRQVIEARRAGKNGKKAKRDSPMRKERQQQIPVSRLRAGFKPCPFKATPPLTIFLAQHQPLGEHLPDPSQRLAGAFFVFNQRESYVPVAVVAEADAGAYGYFGVG